MGDEFQQENSKKSEGIQPFEKRWNISLTSKDVRDRFMNRIWNGLDGKLSMLNKDNPYSSYHGALKYVANGLGQIYLAYWGFKSYVGKDFYQLLHSLELLHAGLLQQHKEDAHELESIIESAISLSEIDLEIQWGKGIFKPGGAKLLDEKLVNEPMKWLAEQKYTYILEPFQKGLSHYMEGQSDSSRFADTVTDMYEALEATARVVNDNNSRLGANVGEFVMKLGLNKEYYPKMLKDYCSYAHDYRHAVKNAEQRMPPKSQEVEAFIYMTGLFIRLSIRQLESKQQIGQS